MDVVRLWWNMLIGRKTLVTGNPVTFSHKGHYAVSIKSGERILLPAVRESDPQTLLLSDGFSCREQIEQTTERRALHLAEMIQLALHQQGKSDDK